MTPNEKLAKIAEIFETKTTDTNGVTTTTHAGLKLERAWVDLKSGNIPHDVVLKNIEHVRKQLHEIGKVLAGDKPVG